MIYLRRILCNRTGTCWIDAQKVRREQPQVTHFPLHEMSQLVLMTSWLEPNKATKWESFPCHIRFVSAYSFGLIPFINGWMSKLARIHRQTNQPSQFYIIYIHKIPTKKWLHINYIHYIYIYMIYLHMI